MSDDVDVRRAAAKVGARYVAPGAVSRGWRSRGGYSTGALAAVYKSYRN